MILLLVHHWQPQVRDMTSNLYSYLIALAFSGSFAFTSPSIYLAYATLSAEVYCPPKLGTLNGTIENSTEPERIERDAKITDLIHTASIMPLNTEDLYSVVPAWPNFKGSA